MLRRARGRRGARGRDAPAGCPAGCSAEVGGERLLTDLRHIGEALHEVALARAARAGRRCWPGCASRCAEGRAGRRRRADPPARLRRRRGAAGRPSTRSKGLQYPVVYLPRARRPLHVPKPTLPLFHDDDGRRCSTSAAAGRDWHDHARRWADEEAGEWLRLLYVAHDPRPVPGRRAGGRRPQQHRRARRCTGCCSAAARATPTVPDGVRRADRRRGRRARSPRLAATAGGPSRRARRLPGRRSRRPAAAAVPPLACRGRSPATVDVAWRRRRTPR